MITFECSNYLPLFDSHLTRFSLIEKNHLVKLLEELVNRNSEGGPNGDAKNPTAADASTILGTGSVSLLKSMNLLLSCGACIPLSINLC